MLPFEIAGLALTIALIGAIVLAREDDMPRRDDPSAESRGASRVITLNHYLVLAAALFCIGLFGVLTSRSALRVVVCVELILNAVNLNLAAFSVYVAPSEAVGVNFVIFLMVVAAAEVGLALAVVVTLNRTSDIGAIDRLRKLRG